MVGMASGKSPYMTLRFQFLYRIFWLSLTWFDLLKFLNYFYPTSNILKNSLENVRLPDHSNSTTKHLAKFTGHFKSCHEQMIQHYAANIIVTI